jgi:23S rRNA (uracil1939-C5)-methyltransferase
MLGAFLKAAVAAESARSHPELSRRIAAARVITSDLGYRLRARLHWDPKTGLLGFYSQRSWQVNDISPCRLLGTRLKEAIPTLARALKRRCAVPVDVEWLEDLDGGCAVAALRPAREGPRRLDKALVPGPKALDGAVDGLHLMDTRGGLRRVWGADSVTMALGLPLEVPIGAFFQGNRHLVEWLFHRVSGLAGDEHLPVWDLHAGVGFLAAAARFAGDRELVLAEPFRRAAEAARRNLPGAAVAVGSSAEKLLSSRSHLPRSAMVLTDPPRAGMSTPLRHGLARWRPHRLLMLACDPATWARDAAHLIDRGYRLETLELIDLFPSTHHVEILACLECD